MVDFKKVMRKHKIKLVREKLKPWSSQEIFQWCKYQDSQRWALLDRSGRHLNSAVILDDDEFKEALMDYEILWLKAIAEYLYYLREKGD